MLGRLLCKLGVHDNQISGWNKPDPHGHVLSVWGYCTRCNLSWQLDN